MLILGQTNVVHHVMCINCDSATHTNPIECFNAALKDECAVILRVPGLPADNPQQSEEASHMGANANCACRKCNVGGSHEFTESDMGYHSLHKVYST